MADDVLLNNAATIERCVARVREEFQAAGDAFANNYSRQDAAILNIQRACEAALDMGHHIIRREKLGIPQSARDVFELLKQAGWIAVHDYQALLLPITVRIITQHLDEFLQFSQTMLQRAP